MCSYFGSRIRFKANIPRIKMCNAIQVWKELKGRSGVYLKDDLSYHPVTVDAVGKQSLSE